MSEEMDSLTLQGKEKLALVELVLARFRQDASCNDEDFDLLYKGLRRYVVERFSLRPDAQEEKEVI